MYDSFIGLDLETTSLSRTHVSIIQIGAVKVVNSQKDGIFNELIGTWRVIKPQITALTGITQKMLEGKRTSTEVLTDFERWSEGLPFVVQNANFDIPIMRNKYIQRLKKPFEHDYVCTMKAGRILYPELPNHRLNTLRKHLKIPKHKHHDASEDACACADIFLCMTGRDPVCVEKTSMDKVMSVMSKFFK